MSDKVRKIPTIRAFERALIAIGLSRREARIIIYNGFVALLKDIEARVPSSRGER